MTVIVATPKNVMPHIGKIWAYLTKDQNGNEGLCACIGPGGIAMPLIAADPSRLAGLTPIAEQLAKNMGMPVVLVEFNARVELRTITGASS